MYVFGGYDQHGMDDDNLYKYDVANSVWERVLSFKFLLIYYLLR